MSDPGEIYDIESNRIRKRKRNDTQIVVTKVPQPTPTQSKNIESNRIRKRTRPDAQIAVSKVPQPTSTQSEDIELNRIRKRKRNDNNSSNAQMATNDEGQKVANTYMLYAVLELEPKASIHDVKINYYKLSRIYHPDKVDDTLKAAASAKFKGIHHAYTILVNPDTKILYDAGDMRVLSVQPSVGKWEHYIRTVLSNDIACARKKYQDSFAEENDDIREFIMGKGSITHLLNVIPFMRFEDQSRIIEIIKQCMQSGKIPKTSIRKMQNR